MANYNDFVLDTATLNAMTTTKKKVVNSSKATYTIDLCSGPDWAITRTKGSSKRTLVFLLSKNQFYFKNKNDAEPIGEIKIKNFFDECEGNIQLALDDQKCCWIRYLNKSCAKLLQYISEFNPDSELRKMLKSGYVFINNPADWDSRIKNDKERRVDREIESECHTVCKAVFSAIPEAQQEDFASQMSGWFSGHDGGYWRKDERDKFSSMIGGLLSSEYSYRMGGGGRSSNLFSILMAAFGHSGIKELVECYSNSPLTKFPHSGEMSKILKARNFGGEVDIGRTFALKQFKDYLFCSVVEQGMAENPTSFWNSWGDYLEQQVQLFGEVNDKYPDYLLTMHQILTYRCEQNKKKVDEVKFKEAVEIMKQYEYKTEKYVVICPKSKDDLVEEGRMQSNCVGGYGDRVANNGTMIFFLRYAATPNKSLVTIEIRPNDTLGQVLARFNHLPAIEDREFVDEWYRKFFIEKKNGAKKNTCGAAD